MSLAPIRVVHPGTDLLGLPLRHNTEYATLQYISGAEECTITKTVQVIVSMSQSGKQSPKGTASILLYHTPTILLPLVYKTCKTLLHITFLLGQILKPEKTTQALSVHRKGTFCIYIECLIVICSKVTTIKRGEKKVSKFGVLV